MLSISNIKNGKMRAEIYSILIITQVESHSSDLLFIAFLNSLIESAIPFDSSGSFFPPKRTKSTIAITIISVVPIFCNKLNHSLSKYSIQ